MERGERPPPPGADWFMAGLWLVTGLGLATFWLPRFPAMQDYPQNLFVAQVMGSFGQPGTFWKDWYSYQLHIGPYNLFYFVVMALAKVCSIETAGKWFLSLSLGLTVYWIWKGYRESPESPPWSLLLAVPFFFNQSYYYGFTNYIISVPLLFLSLNGHRRFLRDGLLGRVETLLFLVLLLFAHPYTVLVFIVLATGQAWLGAEKRIVHLVLPFGMALLFVAWYLFGSGFDAGWIVGRPVIFWWPVEELLIFLLLPLVGMRFYPTVDGSMVALWVGLLLLFGYNGFRSPRRFSGVMVVLLLFSLLGYVLLPFRFGEYSYFNLRLTSVGYLLLVLVLSRIALTRLHQMVYVVLLGGVMVGILQRDMAVSREQEEILPLLQAMRPNESLLALNGDAPARGLDSEFFYQFHGHIHFYYPIVAGGGEIDRLLRDHLHPIRPLAADPKRVYRYVLVRGEVPPWLGASSGYRASSTSGPWTLFEYQRAGMAGVNDDTQELGEVQRLRGMIPLRPPQK